MIILALDTSGEVCSVAVAQDERLLGEYNFVHHRHLTERLPSIVTNLLADTGQTLTSIDAFAVGIGPGSFTGVRVGVTVAKIWATVYQKPLIAVPSLDVLAAQYPSTELTDPPKVIIVITLARKGELIVGYYLPDSNLQWMPQGSLHLVATESLREELEHHFGNRPWVIIAESPLLLETIYQTLFGQEFKKNSILQADTLRAFTVALLAHRKMQQPGFQAEDPEILVPLYVALTPVG